MSTRDLQTLTREQLEERVRELEARVDDHGQDGPTIAEQRYRQLFEHMRSGVAVYRAVDDGADFEFLDFNRAGAAIEQVPRESVLGRRVTEAFPGVEQFGLLDVFRRVWVTGEPESHPIRFYKDARIAGWRDNFVYRLPSGEIVAIYADVTTQKKAEEELRYHAIILDNLSEAVVSTDITHVVRSWNKAAEAIYGYTEAEALGRTTAELVRPEYVNEDPDEAVRTMLETGSWTGETIQHTKDGRPLQIESSVRVLRDDQGQVPGVVGIHRDVSEQRLIESKLAQNERMASVGLLAAGVAHEINNPLTYVLYNLERVVQLLGSEPSGSKDMLLEKAADALEGARRVRTIVKDFGAFSRVGHDEMCAASVNDVLRTAIKFAGNEIRFRALLKVAFGDVPAILLPEGQLAQVFLNLLINAAHAIAEGDPAHNEISVRTWAEADVVAVEITDTGCGIPAQHLDSIFDPFFSTKDIGKGAGLGLSVCHSIVTGLGGSIDVTSRVGEGASFLVRLPVRTSDEEVPVPPAPEPGPLPNNVRILVIDDEPEIARITREMLVDADEVRIATSGQAALAILEQADPFDAIICDLMMPMVTGMDVHAWLSERGDTQAARMVFMSGGAFTPRAKAFVEEVGNPKLLKPFGVADLLAAVATVMDNADSRA